jgi:hypothetical protein
MYRAEKAREECAVSNRQFTRHNDEGVESTSNNQVQLQNCGLIQIVPVQYA